MGVLDGLLKSKKREPIPQKPDTLRRLEMEYQLAHAAFLEANEAYSDAVADEAEGYAGEVSVSEVEKALHIAKGNADRARLALDTCLKRQESLATRADTQGREEAWSKAHKLAESRVKHINRVAEAIRGFADEYAALMQINQQLYDVLPNRVDPDGACLYNLAVEEKIRQEMVRLGVSWAIHHPWGAVSMPVLADYFAPTPDLIRRWHEADTRRAS